MKIEPDDFAFPFNSDKPFYSGLTKREYFATMALQGIIARQHASASQYGEAWAKDAVFLAEQLISALNKYT